MSVERSEVLDWLTKEARRPLTFRELADMMGLPRGERPRLQAALRGLVRSGELVRIKGGRYGLPRKMNLVVGELRASAKGFGFVVPRRGDSRDVFVRGPRMGGALHGDEVVARVEKTKDDGRLEGSIIRILERANKRILGKLELSASGHAWVVPLEPKLLLDVIVGDTAGAREGELVEVEIQEFPGEVREATGQIVDRIGHVDDPAIDLELAIRRNGLPIKFPSAVQRAARAIPDSISRAEIRRRRDFRDDVVVTIDGETARDFDDAIAVSERPDGGYQLAVHIADVSHFVAPGTALDQEALRRGTSVYFPDRVLPMLPEELSNGVCSLKPMVDRLVLSVIIDLDPTGAAIGHQFHEGVIHSRGRLTYPEVHRILIEGSAADRDRHRELVPHLERMHALAQLLAGRRRERGSMDFDLPVGELILGPAGEMTGIRRAPNLASHDLIEEFMLLANETVARHFVSEDLPSIYRVHDPPEAAEVEALNRSLATFGHAVAALSPKSFAELVVAVRGRPEERFVNTLVLRTMRLAQYMNANHGHFGLAAGAYTHFTSPIRRYPDLVVHRRVKAWLTGEHGDEVDRAALREELEQVAETCSSLARRAEEAEREVLERKKARFMADKIGQRFGGTITSVAAFGFFVELDLYFVEGLVHLTSLHDDFYVHDQDKHQLVGGSTGRRFRLGDELEVEVAHVDLLRRQVDVRVVDARPPSRPPSRARRRRARSS